MLLRTLLLSLLFFGSTELTAQEMPAGWQSLPAATFVDTAEGVLTQGPTIEHRQQIVDHAWNRFLSQSTFVASGDWATVQAMTDRFSSLRKYRSAAPEQIANDLQTLQQRLSTRLATDTDLVDGSTLSELHQIAYTLKRTGQSDFSEIYADWMESNAWQSLSAEEQSQLYGSLVTDQIDRNDFTVRWTGAITPTVSGDYRFSQLRHYGDDPQMKVTLGGRTIFDSTDGETYQSALVALTAGQSQAIEVELTHKIDRANSARKQYPLAVLLWQTGEGEPQVVPSAVLSTDFAPGESGLKGTYTSGGQTVERLDSAIEFIWDQNPICPLYNQQRKAILHGCRTELLSASHVASLDTPKKRDEFFGGCCRRFASGMTVSERTELAARLSQQPGMLAQMSPYRMHKLLGHFYLLPGDTETDLVGNWSATREQPRAQIGMYRSHLASGYARKNLGHYWGVGQWMDGPLWPNAEKLLDENLERSDGECDLTLAYSLAYSAQLSGRQREYLEAIQTRLDDESITGDVRMTWLVARAYAEEVLMSHRPRLGRGLPFLQEAILTAESNDYRFWALQEQIARLASLGESERVGKLLDQYAGQFTAPQQQTAIGEWRELTSQLAARYDAQPEQNDAAAQKDHIQEIERRHQEAVAKGDQQAADGYARLLEDYREAQRAK